MLNSLRKKIEVPDIGNPENLTREERLSRLLHHRMISRKQLKTYSDDHLFEHFLVVGVPARETLKFKRESRSIPHVLYQYPKDKPLEALRIAQFLFPDGVRAKSRPQSASHSDLFEALYAQQHLKHPEDSHAFLLTTETKEILYGMCITRQEPVNVSQRVYDVDFSMGTVNELVASDTVVLAFQSYCFISKFPFFELHFSVLKQILGIQHMQTAKFQFEEAPTMDPLGAQSLKPESGSMSPKHCDISNNATLTSSSPIKDLLEVYHNTKIPHPDEDIYLQLSPHLEQIHFHRAAKWDDADGFLRFGLAVTFAHFPKELIIQILSAIMLEKRIVFFCTNMRMLSSIVVSFVSIMRPFIYQSVFLPVIPQSLQVVYTAPVPFVVGATSMPKESELYDELLIVDIAAKQFIVPESCKIPLIPQHKALCNKLEAPLRKLTRLFSHNYPNNLPYNPTNEELQQVFAVASIFQTHFSNLFQNFKSHTITDVSDYSNPISVFLKENFMLIEFAESEEDQEFMKMFMDTQMFFDFSDKQLQQKDKDLQQKDKEAKR